MITVLESYVCTNGKVLAELLQLDFLFPVHRMHGILVKPEYFIFP